MNENVLLIENIEIKIYRKKIDKMSLTVKRNGDVILSCPNWVDQKTIETFASGKIDWIRKSKEEIKEKLKELKKLEKKYTMGEKFLFKGTKHDLVYFKSTNNINAYLTPSNQLFINADKNTTLRSKKKFVDDLYRKELQKELNRLIPLWSKKMELPIPEYRIKNMKTRWGTCNSLEKRIWISLMLIEKPFSCIEYVVVHELAHLIESNHSKRFYKILDKYYPRWKEIEKQL